jgi:hypothetical protein
MQSQVLSAAIERQFRSRFRSTSFWTGTLAPVLVVGVLLHQTARATESPSSTMFLAILSALWIGGSGCVREIVDERKVVEREPHLSLLAYGIAKILHAALLAGAQGAILSAFLSVTGVIGIPIFALWSIVGLTALSGAMLALLLSALCNQPSTALAWFPLLLVPQVVFGGFLFYYASTTPFSLAKGTHEPIVMPSELRRKPVETGIMHAVGALCVSRWALETYAAEALEQDLNDADKYENAVKVAGFIPLTLLDEPPSETLLRHLLQQAQGGAATLHIDARSAQYYLILVLFVAAQGGLLLVVLPLRDPRRT